MKIHPMKRLVALITALLMVISMMPMAALADVTMPPENNNSGTAENTTGG